MTTALALLLILAAALLLIMIGVLCCLAIDGSRAYAGFMDHLSLWEELLAFLLFPLAVPLLMRRHRHARRR